MASIYEPLDPQKYEIRMLVLHPGPTEFILKCSLEKAFLINPTNEYEYAALSYCWGDPKIISNIMVNDMEYPVTANLADALRQLRSIKVTHIWVDALCINQADEEEKGYQIRYMKYIYSRAKETYAWIGKDESGRSNVTLCFLQTLFIFDRSKLSNVLHSHPLLPTDRSTQTSDQSKLSNVPHSPPTLATDKEALSSFDQSKLSDVPPPPPILPTDKGTLVLSKHIPKTSCKRCLMESNFRALVSLFDQNYWKRCWIIQEIAVASRVQIMCGTDVIALDEMKTAISRCQASCYWLPHVDRAYRDLKKVLLFHEYYQSKNKPFLCDAIVKSRNSLATDVRDRIFALLGICGDGDELIPEEIGYQYHVEVIIMNITKALIRKTGSLDLILHGGNESTRTLPSWSPDWLSDDISLDALRLAEKLPRSSAILPPDDMPIDCRTLQVRGTFLGAVLDITSAAKIEISIPSDSTAVPSLSIPMIPLFSSNHEEGQPLLQARESIQYEASPMVSTLPAPLFYKNNSETVKALTGCIVGDLDENSPYSNWCSLHDSGVVSALFSHWYILQALLQTVTKIDAEKNSHGGIQHPININPVLEAFHSWAQNHSAFAVEGKSLKDWLKTGNISHLWFKLLSLPLWLLVVLWFVPLVLIKAFDSTSEPPRTDSNHRRVSSIAIFVVIVLTVIPITLGFLALRERKNILFIRPVVELGLSKFVHSSRRLIVSDTGFLATTSSSMPEIGDTICVLAGCSTAVIMRPVRVDEDNLQSQYQIVGQAHVYLGPNSSRPMKENLIKVLIELHRQRESLQTFNLI